MPLPQLPVEKRQQMSAAAMRTYPNIVNDWGLKEQEAALLLGVPESTYRRWCKQPAAAWCKISMWSASTSIPPEMGAMHRKERAVYEQAKNTPEFKTEAEEREFWETHDSSGYVDWNQAERASFPKLKPSTKTISLRLPEALLDRIKIEANKRDMPYQSLIKAWLADDVNESRRSG